MLSILWFVTFSYLLFLCIEGVFYPGWEPYQLFEHYFIIDQVIYIFLIFFIMHIIMAYKAYHFKKGRLAHGFKAVRDLIRGTIKAEVSQIWEAYNHFKKLPGVRVVEVKSLKKIE